MKPLRLVALSIVLLLSLSGFSSELSSQDSLNLRKAESYLIAFKTDSVRFLLESGNFREHPGGKRLWSIINSDEIDYKTHRIFLNSIGSRPELDKLLFSNYISEVVTEPVSDKANVDYGFIKWYQITVLRNKGEMDLANAMHSELQQYISKFNPNDVETKRVQGLANTHSIVMAHIQGDLEGGKQLCFDTEELARDADDTLLLIAAKYHLADFLMSERDLMGFIQVNEENYALDKTLGYESNYYIGSVMHLINAYIFKGGEDEDRIWELFEELYAHPTAHMESYSLYFQYLKSLPLESPIRQDIFEKFGVSNIIELSEITTQRAEDKIAPNDFFYLIREIASALAHSGHYDEAMAYMNEAVFLTRKIYSADLSHSIADFETKQAIREKQIEISHEKEKSQLYVVISLLAGILLLLTLGAFYFQRRKNQLLKLKHDEIEERDAEKAMLLKEIHHRVKNNFQIVSSLLELQAKQIEDEKAREVNLEGQNRIKSMAYIHQRLYQNDDLLIYFDEYIEKLVAELRIAYGKDQTGEVLIEVPKIGLDVDTAIPLGLIINELVTNSFKYASEAENARLDIALKSEKDGAYKLTISDNGSGLPEGLDIQKTRSMGLRLVRRLVEQIEGELIHEQGPGCSFSILFNTMKLSHT